MRHELLTILFIRSSYKIRKFNMPFVYYLLLKFLAVLFVLGFVGLIGLVIFLNSKNQALQSELYKVKQAHREAFLNGEAPVLDDFTPSDQTVAPAFKVMEIDSQLVDIRDFRIENTSQSLTVHFNLVNTTNPNRQMQGYIFTELMDELSDTRQSMVVPIKAGYSSLQEIDNFKTGDSFSINYFKLVDYHSLMPAFDTQNVLFRVYSSTGDIIYQKIKSVNDEQE